MNVENSEDQHRDLLLYFIEQFSMLPYLTLVLLLGTVDVRSSRVDKLGRVVDVKVSCSALTIDYGLMSA